MAGIRLSFITWGAAFCIGIIGLLGAGCGDLASFYFRDSVHKEDGEVKVQGIQETVTIRRDTLGIPFIDAKTTGDLAFGIGYANAQDRLSQMIGFKMMAEGRLSEMVGSKCVKLDMYMRALNLRKVARLCIGAATDDLRSLLDTYCEGVNASIEIQKKHLPPDLVLSMKTPEKWTPEDSIIIFALLNLGLGFNFHEEINALNIIKKIGYEKAAFLYPIYPDEPLPFKEALKLKGIDFNHTEESLEKLVSVQKDILEMIPLGVAASNNWAISKEKTKNRATILANDTHLPISLPSIWHMMHVRSPEYNVAGIGIAGLPAIVAGYNGHIAWGMTMVMADTQDIFLEQIKYLNGKPHYLYKNEWLPVQEREETFRIKGWRSIKKTIYETIHGPLMNDILSEERRHDLGVQPVTPLPLGIALSWAAFEKDPTISEIFNLGRVRSVREAAAVIRKIQAMPLNMVFADKDNIGWQVTGRYPIRKSGKGLFPSPGWNGEYDWTGFLAPEMTPGAINPPEGFLATANNRTIGPESPITLSSSWHYPERVERIREVIGASDAHTLSSCQTLQYDLKSPYVQKLKNALFEPGLNQEIQRAIAGFKDEKEIRKAREALDILKRFDGKLLPESGDAVILGALLYAYTRNTFLDELGPESSHAFQSFLDDSNLSYSPIMDHIVCRGDESPFWDNVGTPEKETKAMIVAKSLGDAISLIEERLGQERSKWAWGKLHTYHFRTETTRMAKHMGKVAEFAMKFIAPFFDRGPYPAGGCFTTVNVAGYNLADRFDVWLIPEMRMVVDFSLEEPLYVQNSTGQSGNPVSPHYGDGITAWLKGEYQPFPFKEEAILKHYTKVFKLTPSGQ